MRRGRTGLGCRDRSIIKQGTVEQPRVGQCRRGEGPGWWAREMGFCRLVDVKLWDFLGDSLAPGKHFPMLSRPCFTPGGECGRGPWVHTEQVLSPGQTGVERAGVPRFEAEMKTYGRRGLEVPSSPLPESLTCSVCGRGGVCGASSSPASPGYTFGVWICIRGCSGGEFPSGAASVRGSEKQTGQREVLTCQPVTTATSVPWG